MAELEYMTVPLAIKQLPDGEDANIFKFEGMASTFDLDLDQEHFVPGAFKASLKKETPVILWQHDRHEPIGVPSQIKETDDGLFMVGDLPKADTFVSGRVIPQMKIGSIKSMSVGFRREKSEMDENTGIRALIQVALKEVSLVTFPANPKAMISGFKSMNMNEAERKEFLTFLVKELGGNPKVYNVNDVKEMTQREFEKVLRDSGLFSKEASTTVASYFKHLGEPDNKVSEAIRKMNADLPDLKQIKASNLLATLNQKLESL